MSTNTLVRLFPTIDEFRLDLSQLKIDGKSPASCDIEQDLAPEFGTPFVDISRSRGWTSVSVSVSATPSFATLPEQFRSPSIFKALLCISSPTSKVRRAVPLTPTGESGWVGTIIIDRLEVRDRVVANVRVMTPDDVLDQAGKMVWFRGAVVGESAPVDLYVDENARPYNGPIKWSWEDFGASGKSALQARPTDLFFIDSTDAPIVYLNKSIPDFKPVLDGKDRTGPWSGIRHAVEVAVAVPVYIHLLLDALLHFSKDDDSEEYSLDGSWRAALVKACVKTLFPGEAPTTNDVLRRFREQFDDPLTRGTALAVVLSLAQRFVKVDRKFASAVDAAEAFAKEVEPL